MRFWLRLVFLVAVIAIFPFSFSPSSYSQECCKTCSKGKPCGNSCISRAKTCHKPPGCACAGRKFELSRSPVLLFAYSPAPQKITVYDGDNLTIDGRKFRLEGIDAPEMKQTCADQNGREFLCGRTARAALKKMLGDHVDCVPTGTSYDRELAYCSSNGIDLNRAMVQQGWAYAFLKYNKQYLPEEESARATKRGLWMGTFQAPWEWRAAQLEAFAPTGSCVIKGNISKKQRTYFLPFHLLYAKVKIDERAGERWFCTESEAMAAGWKRALR